MIERYRDGWCPSAEPPRSWRPSFDGIAEARRAAHRRGRAHRRARRDLAARPRLNRYVQDEEPWKLAKDEAEAERARPGALRARRGPARGLGAAAPVHARLDASACSTRSARTARSTARALRRGGRRRARSASSASSSRGSRPRRRPPEAEPVIDTHCHLDICEPPVAELVERARGGGRDPDRHGRDERRVDRARARRGRGPRRRLRDRRAPSRTRRPGFDDARDSRRSSARRPIRGRARSARPGSTTTATTRRGRTSSAPSRRSSSWRRASACRS